MPIRAAQRKASTTVLREPRKSVVCHGGCLTAHLRHFPYFRGLEEYHEGAFFLRKNALSDSGFDLHQYGKCYSRIPRPFRPWKRPRTSLSGFLMNNGERTWTAAKHRMRPAIIGVAIHTWKYDYSSAIFSREITNCVLPCSRRGPAYLTTKSYSLGRPTNVPSRQR